MAIRQSMLHVCGRSFLVDIQYDFYDKPLKDELPTEQRKQLCREKSEEGKPLYTRIPVRWYFAYVTLNWSNVAERQ